MSTAELCFADDTTTSAWRSSPLNTSWVGREVTLPRSRAIPRWLFVADGVRLTTSVPVKVTVGDEAGHYYAECPGLHVFADGATQADALDDLDQQVVHFYNFYTSAPDDGVTGLAAHLKEVYQANFTALAD